MVPPDRDDGEPAWRPQVRTGFLIDAFGDPTVLADALGVEDSEPARWQEGSQRPDPATARMIVDLDHVVARAAQIWAADVVVTWLQSSNPYLDGATPLEVLQTRGSAEVLDALDATLSGAFA